MNRKLTYMLLLLTVIAIMGVPQAAANSQIQGNFTTLYGVAGTRIATCATCHTTVPTLNPYGLDLQADASFNRNNPIQAMQNIEPDDSDTDTFINIDEIHNRTFPGNATDFPPKITSFSPATPVSDTGTPATRTFSVVVNQVVSTVTWFLDGNLQKTDTSVSASNFAATTSVPVLHNVTAVAQKTGDGSAMQIWEWNVTTVTPSENGTIAGMVTNVSSGQPIAGATVTADGMTTTTNASGNYSISLAPGTYTVIASAANYNSSTPVSVTVNANATTIQDFALTPIVPQPETGTIAGIVTNASSGLPIPGATVTADGKTATTDNTGNYSMTIAPGTYNVTAGAAGYENITVTDVIVTANTTNSQDFALIPTIIIPGTGTIAGMVTNVSSGLPIAGATVTADGKTATTDNTGNYSITIVPGTYTVTANATGYEDKAATGVVVTENTTTTQDFALTPKVQVETGTIAGKVTNASSGSPIAGATVTADGETATTDASGNYSITIAPGTYTVTASATGYENSTPESVTVNANATTTQNFALTPVQVETGTIAGKVTNASSGSPIAGATVTADGETATTDASGNYSITIAPGTYTVTANAAGYENETAMGVIVNANATTTQDFALTPIPPVVETGTIAGMVTNASSGLPIAGATVTADGETATTDASGNYSITIAPGTYTVTASAAGYQSSTPASVTVTANTTTTQNFALTKIAPTENGSISGRVINDATDMGIPNVEIKLVGVAGTGADTRSVKMETTTDSTGMWTFDNLPAGRYIIIEKLPKGYIPVTSPVMNIMLEQGEDSTDNDFRVKPISALVPPMQV